MEQTRQYLGAFVASLFGVLGLVACGPPPEPVHATIQVPTFRVHDQPEMTKDGLTVAIRPIMEDSVRSLNQLYKTVSFTSMRRPKNMFGGEDTTQPPQAVQQRAEVSIIPLPAFYIKVANHTGHVLRFTQAVFRLQSGSGQNYEVYSGTSEILAWLENVWNTTEGFGPEVAKQVMPGLTAAVNGLPFLTRNRELLNGDEWSGYLVFNLNISGPKDYDAFLASIERLTLRLAELPVETSEAGQVTKTTEFTFVVDKVTAPLRVKCPPGTSQPSTSICSKEI